MTMNYLSHLQSVNLQYISSRKEFVEAAREFVSCGFRYFNIGFFLILSLIIMVWQYAIMPDYAISWDCMDYTATWDSYVAGTFDGMRTPLYPLFIGPINALFGTVAGGWVAVTLQKLIHFVACFYVWRICKALNINAKLIAAVIFVWLVVPCFYLSDHDLGLMTDSLSVSMWTFALWSMVVYIVKPSVSSGLWMGIWGLLLTLDRPGNLVYYIAAATLVVATLLCRKHVWRPTLVSVAGLAGGLLVIGMYISFTNRIMGQGPYGWIPSFNNFYLLCDADADLPEYIDDPQFREKYEAIYIQSDSLGRECLGKYWFEAGEMFYNEDHNMTHCRDMVARAMKDDPALVWRAFKARTPRFMLWGIYRIAWSEPFPQIRRWQPRMFMFVAAWLFASFWFAIKLIRCKRREKVWSVYDIEMLWMLIIAGGVMLTGWMGGMADYGRLTVHGWIMIYIPMAGILSNWVPGKWRCKYRSIKP